MSRRTRTAPDGFLVIDKLGGVTSHDVVAQVRRAVGTRRVGHAGTLDPMATGVLVLGVERATRLLRFVTGTTKTYDATIRLGVVTTTDDAEGTVVAVADPRSLTESEVRAALSGFVGEIQQRPSAVSAIHVDGRRAHELVREGVTVELEPRAVVVDSIVVHSVDAAKDETTPVLDVAVTVVCSAGTYIRAIARDLGTQLETGGHLTALQRTAVGPFQLADAVPLDAVTSETLMRPAAAIARLHSVYELDDQGVRDIRNGATVDAADMTPDQVGLVDQFGRFIAMADLDGDRWAPTVVFGE